MAVEDCPWNLPLEPETPRHHHGQQRDDQQDKQLDL
jgi:hypothetical protein